VSRKVAGIFEGVASSPLGTQLGDGGAARRAARPASLPDRLSQRRLDRESVRAVALGHERASERSPSISPRIFTSPRVPNSSAASSNTRTSTHLGSRPSEAGPLNSLNMTFRPSHATELIAGRGSTSPGTGDVEVSRTPATEPPAG
jgi:hypothetical protein